MKHVAGVAALAATAALLAGCAQQAVAGHAVPGQGLHAAGLADRTQLDLGATEAVPAAVPPAYIDVTGQGQELPRDAELLNQASTVPIPGAMVGHRAPGHPGMLSPCTVGPIVTDTEGRKGFITAGHCGLTAETSPQWLTDPSDGTDVPVGFATKALETTDDAIDSAVVWTGLPIAPAARRIAGTWPVVGVMSEAEVRALPAGTTVCLDGTDSGVRCGPTVMVTAPGWLWFNATSHGGDSGGPVFVVNQRREAVLLGIVKGAAGAGVGATLLAPALQRIGVTAVTAVTN